MDAQRVLVTGSAGTIGRIVCRALLARGHAVRAFDLQPTPAVDDARVGSITDRTAVDSAAAGMTTLVHLAATPDDADFLTDLLPNNIVGLYHVMEAARAGGVQRVILASTIQVSGGLPRGASPIRVEDGVAPYGLYGATKIFAESVGRVYAKKHGMVVIAARIGWLPRNPENAAHVGRHPGSRAVYLSHTDAARFFTSAVEAPCTGFAALYVVSRNAGRPAYDLAAARQTLGYTPEDDWPAGLPPEWGLTEQAP